MAARARRQVGRVAAFWDSSALVPLCAHQALTPRARSLYQEYEVTVWWATPVEMARALARLLRMQQISVLDFRTAKRLATALSDIWWVVQPSELLRASALTLIEQYDLRAADSFQLAAAMQWCEDQPQGRVFLTADHRLREAAHLRGFETGYLEAT